MRNKKEYTEKEIREAFNGGYAIGCEQTEERLEEKIREILGNIKHECWDNGMNMSGEYQGVWIRYKDIEGTIDRFLACVGKQEGNDER